MDAARGVSVDALAVLPDTTESAIRHVVDGSTRFELPGRDTTSTPLTSAPAEMTAVSTFSPSIQLQAVSTCTIAAARVGAVGSAAQRLAGTDALMVYIVRYSMLGRSS